MNDFSFDEDKDTKDDSKLDDAALRVKAFSARKAKRRSKRILKSRNKFTEVLAS